MNPPFVIVWDLDNTLGEFSELSKQGASDEPIRVRLRPGIAETLRSLSAQGFVHTVLTLAFPLYTEIVLRGTGLRSHFALVDCLGQRNKGDAAGIGDALGIAESDRPHRMFFVGDNPFFDAPRDPRVVFHIEDRALTRPAADLERLVLFLRDHGEGSLRNGFDRLHDYAPGELVRRIVPGLGSLLMATRKDGCPALVFEQPPGGNAGFAEHSFVPSEVADQIQAEREQSPSPKPSFLPPLSI